MNKKRLIVSAGLTFTGAAIALTLAFQRGGNAFFMNSPRRAQVPVDFVEEVVTRRVYFTNNDNYWDGCWDAAEMAQLYVYAWQWSDSTNKTSEPVPATRMIENVRQNQNTVGGLYYADVTFAGAGDEIGVIVLTDLSWSSQTADLKIPSLWSSSPDVVYLNSGGERKSRNTSAGSFSGMSDAQMADFLSNYETCSDAYTNGYNAYPQIMKDFCPTGKIYDGSTAVTDYDYQDYVEHGKSYDGIDQNGSTTITDKLVAMQSLYETNGYSLEKYHVPFTFSNAPYTCVNGKTSTITYEDVVGNTYSNVYSYLPEVPSSAIGIKFTLTNNSAAYMRIDADVGTSSPSMVSHLIRTGEGEDWAPYDWFNTENNRGHYGIAASSSRECTFLFDQSAGVIDGFLMYVDSAYSTADLHSGSIVISNAVYLF